MMATKMHDEMFTEGRGGELETLISEARSLQDEVMENAPHGKEAARKAGSVYVFVISTEAYTLFHGGGFRFGSRAASSRT